MSHAYSSSTSMNCLILLRKISQIASELFFLTLHLLFAIDIFFPKGVSDKNIFTWDTYDMRSVSSKTFTVCFKFDDSCSSIWIFKVRSYLKSCASVLS